MAKLKVILKADVKQGAYDYNNQFNPQNYKDIAQMLRDLKSFGSAIDKGIKEYQFGKSDWDSMLSMK